MTRNGKIARLPKDIREELNRRLEDAEQGKELVEWLNSLPEVQSLLAEDFSGRAISEQNLSEWRNGGYREWLAHQEACEKLRWMTERAGDLDEAADGLEISDRLASVLAAELAGVAEKLLEEVADPKERWERLREVLRELAALRKEDHKALRLQLEQERWSMQADRLEEEDLKRVEKERKDHLFDLCFAKMHEGVIAEGFGGGEYGKKMADMLTRIRLDLPLTGPSKLATPGQVASDPIKSSQTQSN